MNRRTCASLLVFCSVVLSAAQSESVKDSLNRQYKKQILALRSPFAHGDMKFDSAGKPLHLPPNGPWLIYGGILVEKLNLSADTLLLQGPRAMKDVSKRKPEFIPLSKAVRIEIHLDRPLQSLDEARALLDRVFYLQDDDLKHARPEVRRG